MPSKVQAALPAGCRDHRQGFAGVGLDDLVGSKPTLSYLRSPGERIADIHTLALGRTS